MSRPPAPALFLLPALALMPFGRLVEVPMMLMAVLGLAVAVSGSVRKLGMALVPLLLLFGAYSLPMVLALPDAVNPEKSLITTIGSLRYFCSTVFLLWLMSNAADVDQSRDRLLQAVGAATALLLIFWCLDGLWQFVNGQNLLGYGISRGYINGVFGNDENLKFGITVALLMPVGLVYALRRWSLTVAGAFLLLVLFLLLLSGKRAAWIIAALQLSLLAAYYWKRRLLAARRVLLVGAIVIAAVTAAYSFSDWVRGRSDVLWNAAQQRDYESLNDASGQRLPIWSVALRIGSDHWINGVGPRGFRFSYRDYAGDGDRWAESLSNGGARASHSHQLLLEVLCETGVLGLAGLALMTFVLFRLWWVADTQGRSRALPFALSLAGMLFPINTHPAWYSSWSGVMLWFFIGLYLLALYDPDTVERAA